jgi:YhcH/YjgK/YiaL family protein
MIFDNIGYASRYCGLDSRIAEALKAVLDYSGRKPGRYDLDGDSMYLQVLQYDTKPLADSRWEAHRQYIDVHFIGSGDEYWGFRDKDGLCIDTAYDPSIDAEFYSGEGSMLHAVKGSIAVFYPGEPHMTGVAAGASSPVCRIVVKILVSK